MARIEGMVDNAEDLINIIEAATYEYGKHTRWVLDEAMDYIREIRELLPLDETTVDAIRERLDNLENLLIRALET